LQARDLTNTTLIFLIVYLLLYRIAPSIDLVLLSHGDLTHSGLFAYAFARWGLRASTYTTLPVQAVGRIASLEEVTALRMEEDVDPPKQIEESSSVKVEEDAMEEDLHKPAPAGKNGVRIPTIEEVNDAFESIITLRYSQPTHLTG
jgi:cleavage and polyadenylation specificity factor subunit 2